MAERLNEMGESFARMSAGLRDSIGRISGGAHQAAAAPSSVASSSDNSQRASASELSGQSEVLRGVVARFRVGEEAAAQGQPSDPFVERRGAGTAAPCAGFDHPSVRRVRSTDLVN